MSKREKRAVVLLSGGIDSTTVLAVAKSQGFTVFAMSFRYGQRHVAELQAAEKTARALGVKEHMIVDVDLGRIGGSALTGDTVIPKHDSVQEIEQNDEIPVTYVPARNTIFLSYGLALAEVVKAEAIFIGVTAVDYSGYPDCRPEYIHAYEKMANLATKTGVTKETSLEIKTPLITLSKAEIIQLGTRLGVDYALTLSCYDPDREGRSCGRCDSCLHRKKGFAGAGMDDPTTYC
ncbi:MAG TPA: 7-cyano-7-deazaguanine synthase QueC [Desulfobacteraceae bacterium]|nr:7-cyano-7-deazaguanine synthase QueC [Desulfobacteraceae bacterium]